VRERESPTRRVLKEQMRCVYLVLYCMLIGVFGLRRLHRILHTGRGNSVVLMISSSTSITSSTARTLFLGSGSSSRKAILREAGYSFEVVKADIDERGLGDRSSGEGARELVLLLGNAKADAIVKSNPQLEEGVLLTADQVVVCKNQILEKPLNEAEAREYMRWYGDHQCCTVGSIVLTDLKTKKRVSGVDTATITFRALPDAVVSQLIEGGEVFYCAGALMIEHPLVQPYIVSVDGTMESVMGLSTSLLEDLLAQL